MGGILVSVCSPVLTNHVWAGFGGMQVNRLWGEQPVEWIGQMQSQNSAIVDDLALLFIILFSFRKSWAEMWSCAISMWIFSSL